jgi:hypothetical protein
MRSFVRCFLLGVAVAGVAFAGANANAQTQDAEFIPAPELKLSDFQLTQRNTVGLSSTGELRGSVSAFGPRGLRPVGSGQQVRLIRAGEIVGGTQTSVSGEFVVKGVKPGRYTLLAVSPTTIAAYSVNAVTAPTAAGIFEMIAVSEVPLQRSRSMLVAAASMTSDRASIAMNDAGGLEAYGTYRVAMNADGGFRGTARAPEGNLGVVDLSKTTVRIFRGKDFVRETNLDVNGAYSFEGIGAGPLGIVFFGPSGFAAMGLELVQQKYQANIDDRDERFVSLESDVAPEHNVELVPNDDVTSGLDEIESEDEEQVAMGTPLEIPPPFAGGGFGGGGPGSGAGGGGGGGTDGLGGIVGLAALGAALAAGLSGDDDNGFTPAPASPAVPSP